MRLKNPAATEVVKDEKQEKVARIQVVSKGGFGSVQDRLNREYCRTFRAQYSPKRPVGDPFDLQRPPQFGRRRLRQKISQSLLQCMTLLVAQTGCSLRRSEMSAIG